MANIFLAWQNRTDEATLSGGSWKSSLPLTNVQNRQVQKVARSSDAALTSTVFDIDQGSAKNIGVVGLVVHNISTSGKVRISAADSLTAWDNIVVGSNDLTNGAWSGFDAYVTANAATAPDGTTTADKLYEVALTGPHYLEQTLGTLSGARWCEAWVQANGRFRGRMRFYSTGGGEAYCDFDLTEKTITASSGSATLREYETGWFKISLAATFTSGTVRVEFQLMDSTGNNTYTGDGVSGINVWGVRSATGNGMMDDSGYVTVWPAGVVPQDLLEWEDDNFWLGTLSANARAGFQSPYIYRLPNAVSVRYWRVEILDTSNSDGYVQIGRLFMARGWTPSVNYAYGAGLGYQDPTPVETSLSGAEFFDKRSAFRVFSFDLEYITDTEAYTYALELQRLAGISGEVLVMPDGGDDITTKPLRSFVGRLRQIGAVVNSKPSAYSVKFEVKELL